MKLLIVGGSGGVGRHLIDQALSAGHEVTALARPGSVMPGPERYRVVEGDGTSADDMGRAVNGQDAVLSALGSRSVRHPIEVEATEALLTATRRSSVSRLVLCSAFGAGYTYADAAPLNRLFFRTVLGRVYAAKERADALIQASPLDWTLVYPTGLTDSPGGADYEAVEHLPRQARPRISRADVAQFMVAQLTETRWSRKIVVISNRQAD